MDLLTFGSGIMAISMVLSIDSENHSLKLFVYVAGFAKPGHINMSVQVRLDSSS